MPRSAYAVGEFAPPSRVSQPGATTTLTSQGHTGRRAVRVDGAGPSGGAGQMSWRRDMCPS